MKLTRPEYKLLDTRLHAAWLALNRATDTPDSDVSLKHLAEALRFLLAVGRELHTQSLNSASDAEALAFLAERYRHKVSGTENTPATLGKLQARLTQPESTPSNLPHPDGLEPSDPLIINDAIPAMWRVIHGLRRDLKKRRPASDYLLTAFKIGLVLAALAVIFQIATLILPWGAKVVYYRGIDLNTPVGITSEMALVKGYSNSRPCLLALRNNWSARWTGCIRTPQSGTYSFYVQCDDGARLWLDDRLILDNWKDQEWLRSGKEVNIDLTKGSHRFRLEHYKRTGDGAIRVRWTGCDIPANTIVGIPYLFKY